MLTTVRILYLKALKATLLCGHPNRPHCRV